MSDLEREIAEERARLGRKHSDDRAWSKSPFWPTTATVRIPSGNFAIFVREVFPLIPKKLWRSALMGRGPDGETHVIQDIEELSLIARLRLKSCKLYSTGDLYNVLVILSDGRAGYTGELSYWRKSIAHYIASGASAETLDPTANYYAGNFSSPWRFE